MQYFYFSRTWAGLSDGTVVTVTGGTAIIGTDAFGSAYEAVQKGIEVWGDYDETIYVDWELSSPDYFLNTDWDGTAAGDPIYIDVVNPDDPSEVYDGAISLTYGTNAFSTLTSAVTAAGRTHLVEMVGGVVTISSRYSLNGTTLYVSGGSLTGGSGAVGYMLGGEGNTTYDASITVAKGGYASYLFVARGEFKADALFNIAGGTANYVSAGGIYAGYANASSYTDGDNLTGIPMYTSSISVSDGGLVDTIVLASGAMFCDVSVTISDATVNKIYYAQDQGGYDIYGNVYITLDNATITGIFRDDSSRKGDSDIMGDDRYNYINVVGGTSSIGDFQIIRQPAKAILTIDGGATLSYSGSNAYTGAIVINVDGYTMSSGTETLISAATSLAGASSITIVGDNADLYIYELTNNNKTLLLKEKPAYISAGWIGLDDGTVVEIPVGTAVIGQGAFATYAEASAAGALNIESLDVYFNPDWSSLSAGDTVVVNGYTATIGTNAFSTFATARTAYSSSSQTGVISLYGGTYSDASGSGSGQTQFAAGLPVVVEGSTVTTIFGGHTGSSVTKTDMTFRNSNVSAIYAGGRYTTVTEAINLDVVGSTVEQIYSHSLANESGSATINITGSTVNAIGQGSTGLTSTTVVTTYNIADSRLNYGIAAAGTQNASNNAGAVNFNFSNTWIKSLFLNRGWDMGNNANAKGCNATGDVNVHISGGGTTTVDLAVRYLANTSNSVTITIDADSCLVTPTSNNDLANDINFVINVDGYTPTATEKLVFTGKSLSGYNVTITGAGAENYVAMVSGVNTYLVAKTDYFSAYWNALGLEDGDVVYVNGGTAVIGTDAFRTYDDAVAAATGRAIIPFDYYVNTNWTAGEEVEIVIDGSTFTQVVGAAADKNVHAYANETLANSALSANSNYGMKVVTGDAGSTGFTGTVFVAQDGSGASDRGLIAQNFTSTGQVNGATNSARNVYLAVQDSNVGTVRGMDAGTSAITGTININIDGSTVGTLWSLGSTNGTSTSGQSADTYVALSEDIYIEDSVITGVSYLEGRGGGGSYYFKTTGSASVKIVNSTTGTWNYTSWGDAGTDYLGGVEFTFIGSTVGNTYIGNDSGTTVTIDNSRVAGFTYRTGKTADYIVRGESTIAAAMNVTTGSTLTIDAGAYLTTTGAFTNSGAITIDLDGYVFDPDHPSYKVIDTNGTFTNSGTITLTSTIYDVNDYTTEVRNGDLYVTKKPVYYSILWRGLDAGTVVQLSGGTAIVGTDAFATYAEASAVSANVKTPDTFYYQGETEYTYGGDSFVVGDGRAFASYGAAVSNQTGYGAVRFIGGTHTGRVAFSGKTAVVEGTAEYLWAGGGGLVGADQGTGYFESTNVIIAAGGTLTTGWAGHHSGGTVGFAHFTIDEGGRAGSAYLGYSGAVINNGQVDVFGTASTVALGDAGVTAPDGGVITYNINGGSVGTLYLLCTAQAGAALSSADFNVNMTNGGRVNAILVNAGGTVANIGAVTINANNAVINNLAWGNFSAESLSINVVDSLISIFQLDGSSAYTVSGDWQVSISGGSSTSAVATRLGSGTIGGNYDVSASNIALSTLYFTSGVVAGGTVNMVADGVTAESIYTGWVVAGSDMTVTIRDSRSNSSTTAISSGTINGDLNVILEDSVIGNNFNIGPGALIDADSINVLVTGSTTTVANSVINGGNAITITIDDGTLFALGNQLSSEISVVNNGTIDITGGAMVNKLENDLTYSVAHNVTGSGAITASAFEGTTGYATDADGWTFLYNAAQSVVYVDDAFSTLAQYEAVEYGDKTLRRGINAFASTDEVAYLGANGVAKLAEKSYTDSVYGNGTAIELDGGTFAQNVYGGAEVTAAATVADDARVVVDGGSFRGLVAGQRIEAAATVSGDSLLEISDGSGKAAFGGHYVAAGDSTISGDTYAVIHGGTFSSFVTGGNVVATGASAYLTGTSTLTIFDGYFGNAVAGGSDSQGGDIDSDTNYVSRVEIAGGTFAKGVYGGNVASKAAYANFSGNTHSTLIDINGSTEIVVDVTGTNAVNFGASNVVAGSYGQGQVSGTSTVTFTGLGSNLTFTGILTGDSQNGGTNSRMVMGERSLIFVDFDGAFNAKINGFDTVSFANDSAMSFTSANVYLQNVTTWNFTNGSSLAWSTGRNDFSGDTLNLSFESLDGDWTILSGSETTLAGFDDFALVNINGVAADYDLVNNVYTAGDYQLYIDNNAMKLGTIA